VKVLQKFNEILERVSLYGGAIIEPLARHPFLPSQHFPLFSIHNSTFIIHNSPLLLPALHNNMLDRAGEVGDDVLGQAAA
jgi:hypothetical protein